MGWVKALLLVFTRFFDELDKHRAEAKRLQREDRRHDIKQDPLNAHRDLFGAESGRVSVNKQTVDQLPSDRPDS